MADGRVNGSLNLSRALGDLEYKQNRDLPPEEQVSEAGWGWDGVVTGCPVAVAAQGSSFHVAANGAAAWLPAAWLPSWLPTHA